MNPILDVPFPELTPAEARWFLSQRFTRDLMPSTIEHLEEIAGAKVKEKLVEPAPAPAAPAAPPKAAPAQRSDVAVEAAERAAEEGGDQTGAIYEQYVPQRIRIPGAKPHPSPLSQSAQMAATPPPPATYTPNLPDDVIKDGKLSEAQIEAVLYAGQAHEKMLPEGVRRGYFIGDGTGVGKGREIAGVILDNWRQGRRRGVWVSETQNLEKSAARDLEDLGLDPKDVLFNLKGVKKGTGVIERDEGILYTTYSTMRMGSGGRGAAALTTEEAKAKSRIDQIVEWLGEEFDGLIIFDEAHNMGNAVATRGSRGIVQPSAVALAGLELQDRLPNARVLYTSATGATEVKHLSYADRLGLWGEGTPFPDRGSFLASIEAGRIAAMEITARDLKALGLYAARTLSFQDPENRPQMSVEQETLQQTLTDEQRDVYDKLAEAWQVVFRNISSALELTAGERKRDGSTVVDGKTKGAAYSRFYGSMLRFWDGVLTAMKVPALIQGIEQNLANGESAVVQLVATGEAQQERAIAKLEEGLEIEDLNMSPIEILIDYVQKGFPTAQKEQYVHGHTEGGEPIIRWRVVERADGTPVENPEAVAMRDSLLIELASLPKLENALDQLVNFFGPDQVAEITGRSRRRIDAKWSEEGQAEIEKRSDTRRRKEVKEFRDGKRRILVFSDKGGTGESYHADRNIKNTQRRNHYLLQPGWRANKAIQGLGRTHRSNEASAPLYRLLTTDLLGEKRFLSTIARRLSQLGALTKGERETGGQGMFRAEDNLESTEAKDALTTFYRDVVAGRAGSITIGTLQEQMGLRIVDEHGQMYDNLPPISQFLNRLLALKVDEQNRVFTALQERIDTATEIARTNGTLDMGLQDVKGDEITVKSRQTVFEHPETGAKTDLVQLKVGKRLHRVTWEQVEDAKFIRNNRSGKTWAIVDSGSVTDRRSGAVMDVHKIQGPARGQYRHIPQSEAKDSERWTLLMTDDAQKAWQEQLDELPELVYEDMHLLEGVILPIWDRVRGNPQIRRARTADGTRVLGVLVPNDQVAVTMRNLGVNVEVPAWVTNGVEAMSQIRDGWAIELNNGWEIVGRRVAGEQRVEIIGPSFRDKPALERAGVFTELIAHKARWFIPASAAGVGTYESVIEHREVVEARPPRSGSTQVDEDAGYDWSAPRTEPVDFAVGEASASDPTLPKDIRTPRDDLGPDLMETARLLSAPARYKPLRGFMLGVHRAGRPGMIELRDIRWVRTLSHELGHAVDFRTNGDHFPGSIKARFPGLGITEKQARAELKAASEIIRPMPPGESWDSKSSYARYRAFHRELMADLVSLWLLDPAKARKAAPTLVPALEQKIAGSPEVALALQAVLHPSTAKIVVPKLGAASQKFEAPKAEFVGSEFDLDLRDEAFELVKGTERGFRAEMVRIDRTASSWESTLSERQREDVAAFVEKIGNVNRDGDTFRAVAKRMTPAMHKVAKQYRYEQELNRQEANKLFREAGSGPEAISYLEDYIGHFYVRNRKAREFATRWVKSTPHAKQRTFPTLADAVAAGLTPLSTDIAYLYRRTAETNFRAAFGRRFARRIKDLRDANGNPVMAGSRDKAGPDWVKIDHPVLRHVYARRAGGKLILGEGNAWVHPSIARPVKVLLGRPFDGPIAKVIAAINSIGKGLNVGFSFFHEFTLFESAQATNAKFLNPLRGVMIGPIESTQLGLGFRPHLTHRAGLALAANDPLGLADAVKHGLNLSRSASMDYARSYIENRMRDLEAWMKSHGAHVPAKVIGAVRRTYEAYQRHLWNHVHVGHKLFAYHTLVADALERAKGGRPSETFIKETVASFVNDAFGGQEFIEVPTFQPGRRLGTELATPKEMQIAQAVLFAPDWTISNLRVAGRAAGELVKTVTPGTKANPVARRLGLRYWRNMVATLMGSAVAAQYLIWMGFGDDDDELEPFPWNNEIGHEWDVDVTPIRKRIARALGQEEPEGRFYVHAGKQAREVARYFSDFPDGLVEQLGNKSSVLVRATLEQMTSHSAGSGFPMPWAERGFRAELEGWDEVKARAKQAGQTFVPFSFQENNFAFSLPQRKGMTRYKGIRYYADAIDSWIDPSWWDRVKDRRTPEEQQAALIDVMKRVDQAAATNGLDLRTRKSLYSHARAIHRSKWYGRFWTAIEEEDVEAANEAAEMLFRLRVTGPNLRSSAKVRQIDTSLYRAAGDAWRGIDPSTQIPRYGDIYQPQE